MKKLFYIGLCLALVTAFAGFAIAQEPAGGYKAGYEKQMKVVADTQAIINGVVTWLKEHNFQNYEYAKTKVEDAFEQAGFAEEAKKKAEAFAANGNWMQAYFWANQVWQYQVKIADSGLRAKQIVEDAERAALQK